MNTLVATTPAVTIRQVAVSSLDNNVYLLTSRPTGRQILIDAADDPAAIRAMVNDAAQDGPAPGIDLIITTHQHADHIQALAEMAASTQAEIAAGRDDAAAITAQTGVTITRQATHGDTLAVPGIDLDVIALRGHTPGSIALAYTEDGQPVRLFTGDSLFPGGVGNTHHDPHLFTSLLDDVTTRIFDVYGDDTIVHPGHGLSTTLGTERPHLSEWRERGW